VQLLPDGMHLSVWNWLQIGTRGKPIWTRLSTFGFNKRRGISWPSLGNYLLLAKGSVLWGVCLTAIL